MTRKKRVVLLVTGAFAGGISGFLYWKWVGCSSGTCMITSNPLNSTLYFAIMGCLAINMFLPSGSKKNETAK